MPDKTTIREGWGKAFEKMSKRGDDKLLDQENPDAEWDRAEWKWNKHPKRKPENDAPKHR